MPSQNPSNVTVQTSNTSVSGTGRFFDVTMLDGQDTLIAWNMPWVNPDSGDEVGFDNISMGSGDDLVELHRSAFYDTVDMGEGQDTLILDNSSGRDVVMGGGDDFVQLDFTQASAASEEELAQKVGQAPVNIDGGTGNDVLNLVGDWTLTLAFGSFTLDTDYNGSGDTTTSVLRADQYGQVVGAPTLLSGTVEWGEVITLSGGDTVQAAATFSNFEQIEAVCFTAGTLIETPGGPVPVEDLAEGDLVNTPTGPQPIRWIGRRRLDVIDLMANPKLLPVLIPAGAFGPGMPARDMRVSPQHRLAIRSRISARMFGATEVLVPARLLAGQAGIEIDGECREVVYFHFMLDEHAVVVADGIKAETLYPGPHALSFLTPEGRAEILSIFPELLSKTREWAPAMPLIKGRDARALLERHARHAKPLWS